MKQKGPVLAGDKQPIRLRIPGNAVQHRLTVLSVRPERAEIDPAGHFARPRTDPGQIVPVKYIGENLPPDVLQLVQLIHPPTLAVHQ